MISPKVRETEAEVKLIKAINALIDISDDEVEQLREKMAADIDTTNNL